MTAGTDSQADASTTAGASTTASGPATGDYGPSFYRQVYVTGSGRFLPGKPVDNAAMDDYIAPINRHSTRIKRRILEENGILTRHYASAPDGTPRHTAVDMAAQALHAALDDAQLPLADLRLLATGSSGGDVAMPGLANMLQGELKAPPLEAHSHHGICAAGVAALKNVANLIEHGGHSHGAVTTVEYPSRMFRATRFAPRGYDVDFDAHFLRWMLSDGAGACVLRKQPARHRLSLRLDWVHLKSFSGDLPACMQLGTAAQASRSYLDYPSLADAEADGAFLLRQDTRLLPQLFEVAIHEYAALVRAGHVDPASVDHFLCHYSSESLGKVCEDLMEKAGLSIPRERWYSNLARCGNTGSASFFIMLDGLLRERELKPGERILCFVPESGRFTVGFMQLTVVDGRDSGTAAEPVKAHASDATHIAAPHDPATADDPRLRATLQELAAVWHDYRSQVWRTPLATRIREGHMTREDYLRWMACWIPQVREGSIWMRQAAASLSPRFALLQALIEAHAGDEQFDFRILFEDYQTAGGTAPDIDSLRRNPGGEGLNAYMHALSKQTDPLGLLGGIYIIEGTGQRIVPVLLPMLRRQLDLPERCFRFLKYHGENDLEHLAHWLDAVRIVLAADPGSADAIVATARRIAQLYLMQWEHVL
ncbi:MAG: 3-oxoacyl-[acyl-carrier-protein] synthase III C-terminal domain-containing protein [Moraxellaceae bacterium]|nr:3-oxoacyl-[acyl-carrier-protein] synthase III C-terminal domain-containing protein [Moraxellaceae bacterium]